MSGELMLAGLLFLATLGVLLALLATQQRTGVAQERLRVQRAILQTEWEAFLARQQIEAAFYQARQQLRAEARRAQRRS